MTVTEASGQAGRRPHVIVVGGGFAGVSAVRALRSAPVDVTLIDRDTYNAFQPLLYQVATAGLNPGEVTYFLRAVRMRQRNVRVRQAEVVGVDTARQTVTFSDGWSLDYDYLILASGATTNYFGTPGAEEHAKAIYTRPQALAVRDAIFTELEHAAESSSSDLAIMVVGGGATGVEMAGALAEWRNDAMPAVYPELDPDRTRIVLIEMGAQVLAAFAPSLRRYAERALRARGVELRLQTAVAEVRSDGVLLKSGEFLPAGVVVWAAGVRVPEVVQRWGVPQGRGGRIQVDDDLRVPGFDTVFATGDVAIGPVGLPQLAQPAIQQGRHAGRQVAALATGGATSPFRYHDKGTLATIGRRSAVAEIGVTRHRSVRLAGSIAWLIWLFVHIVMLLGNRNRLATFVNLFTKYLAPGAGPTRSSVTCRSTGTAIRRSIVRDSAHAVIDRP